jgi:hypothetical protein
VATWRDYAQRRGERRAHQLECCQWVQGRLCRRVMQAWRQQAAEGRRLRATAAQLLHM